MVVGQTYDQLISEMAIAEQAYEQQQLQRQQAALFRDQPSAEAQLLDELSQDAEAGELLQALLQDYMMSENIDTNSQEYEDFLGESNTNQISS